ncbi:MAG: SMP-30/gluconolactonase/LRE family protein [Sphingomonadaceae bacterium]
MRIEVLIDVKTRLGEGPLWDVDEQRLYWLDGVAGTIYRCTAQGGEVRAWDLPCRIGSLALREGGGAVVALASGIHLLDFDTGDTQFVVNPEIDRPDNVLNDGKVDRQGRFVFGSMDSGETSPSGALYRLNLDLSVHRIDDGIICSNGPCWSPDGKTFYFQDSYAGEIRAYDYHAITGNVANRRSFAKLVTETGAADGSTVDAEGCVWNAQIFDGMLVRYRPDGQVDRMIKMPVKKVTSVMFGGPGLDILYVTSMGAQLHPHFPADGRLRGSLFAIYGLGVTGLPERRFAG